MEVGGVAEDQIDAKADWDGFGMQRVFDEGLDFGGFEEFLEGIARGEHAVAEGLHVVIGLLPGDECGDEQGAAGVFPCIDQRIDAFGGCFDDVEDEAEVDDVGGLFRSMDRIPATGWMAEFFDGCDIAAVAAAVVEERFAAAELAELQQGLHWFGDFPANKCCLMSMNLLYRLRLCRWWFVSRFHKPVPFETQTALCQ